MPIPIDPECAEIMTALHLRVVAILLHGADQLDAVFPSAVQGGTAGQVGTIHKLASGQQILTGKLLLPSRDDGRQLEVPVNDKQNSRSNDN